MKGSTFLFYSKKRGSLTEFWFYALKWFLKRRYHLQGGEGPFWVILHLKFVEKGNLQRRSRNIWLCLADHNQIKPQSISLGIIFLKDACLQFHILCFSRISYTFYSKYGSDLCSPKTPECFIRNFLSYREHRYVYESS